MNYYTSGAATEHRRSHPRYISAGSCPAVSRSKSWCNGKAGHAGPHHAPYLGPGGKLVQRAADFWIDHVGCPCEDSEVR